MIEGLTELFVLLANHSGQIAPLIAFAVVTAATLPHAIAGRARQTVAGMLAGAAFVAMFAMFTVVEARDLRNLFPSPLDDFASASLFAAFAALEGVAAVALVLGRHGFIRVAPEADAAQD